MTRDNKPLAFLVSETKKNLIIRWQLPGVETVAEFLYWANDHGARYEFLVTDNKFTYRLHALSGTHGEHKDNIRWSPELGLHRLETGTHYLTQHGLDGLPQTWIEQAFDFGGPWREEQIFKIAPLTGGFSMSYEEWENYFVAGKNSRNLSDLSITVTRLSREAKRGKP